MQRLLRGLVLASVIAIAAGAAVQAQGTPRIRFDERTHDFGELRSDDKRSVEWVFHNDGDAALTILNTRSSCGCTMALLDEAPVPPGGRGVIRVSFDPAGLSGTVRKTLVVASDDPEEPLARLTVRAKVIPLEIEQIAGDHPPIAGQSLLMGECASCHADAGRGKTGEALYAAVCAMCHGDDATGGLAPSLRNPSYLDARTDEELHQGIAFGTANPRMPGFSSVMGGPLDDEQVRSLVRVLREWGPRVPED